MQTECLIEPATGAGAESTCGCASSRFRRRPIEEQPRRAARSVPSRPWRSTTAPWSPGTRGSSAASTRWRSARRAAGAANDGSPSICRRARDRGGGLRRRPGVGPDRARSAGRCRVSCCCPPSRRTEDGLIRLRVRIENLGEWEGGADREGGAPPFPGGRPHAARGARRRFRVAARSASRRRGGRGGVRQPAHLAGADRPEGTGDVLLSSPIILYDHPAVAAESAGDLCDATEIDEILTLRVDDPDRRREARGAGDRRARRG